MSGVTGDERRGKWGNVGTREGKGRAERRTEGGFCFKTDSRKPLHCNDITIYQAAARVWVLSFV